MEFHKPGPNKRVCAFLIDFLVADILSKVFYFLGVITIDWIMFVWIACMVFKDIFDGRSLGKRIVYLQVVDEANQTISKKAAIIRNLIFIIPIFPLVEYFLMLHDPLGQRIGDKLAKTKVCDLKPANKDIGYFWMSVLIVILIIVVKAGVIFCVFLQR